MRLKYLGFPIVFLGLAATSVAAWADWFKDEAPPPNAKPLSAIIKSLEDRGYRIITEVEFDDGKWQIEVHQTGGKELEIHVDAITGQIVKE